MANTVEECRELCAKYTTLRENEIQEIFPFLGDLQMLAEREQANVYIDCMTYTGKSMVIVGEAFPESKGTIYTEPLFGKMDAEALANEFKESVNVAVRDETRQDGYYAVTIYQVKGSKRTLGVSETIGQSYGCYYSGVGKALLAFSDDLDYRKIMQANIEQYTPYTITDNKAFIEEIEKVKEQGYAIDNQEQEPGLCCIACPVLDRRGRAVMAMSLSGYEGNIRALGFENIAARLKQACNEMSNRIR